MAEGSAHGNTPASLKISDEDSGTASEGSDADSDTPLDLTWKTQEASLTQEQKKIRYPKADASSHVPSKSGKTLEHSHFTERREHLHHHEQAQGEECGASSEAMKEHHQQESDDKGELVLRCS
ncbi:hypothetical protein HPB50_022445 [Hyalomma asiaticum]|uniref:Uncharacterized protein n=1 Tax=Hyalomma asiaticum TaxID=266040 RepID=A0ACB7RML5_HYAAI|nr:hypothetical protein HPB50_022445 [Hyalomma asiaticum]